MAVKKTTRAKATARGKKPIGLTSAIGPKATTALVICVIAGGMMVGARQQDTNKKHAPPADARAETSQTAAVKPAPAANKAISVSAAPAASPAAGATPAAASAPSATRAARATVVGCLEPDGVAYRLTDTTGADAPKARSWKSGFLKKGLAPVKLVGSSTALNLASHVGRRISVTGTLANREMQAYAVHRVAGTCKAD